MNSPRKLRTVSSAVSGEREADEAMVEREVTLSLAQSLSSLDLRVLWSLGADGVRVETEVGKEVVEWSLRTRKPRGGGEALVLSMYI
jgi:hypothetical protein